MTHLFRQLQRRQAKGEPVRAAVIGAGFMGRGIVYQLAQMDGMYPSLVVNRTAERAVEAYALAGFKAKDVLISDDPRALGQAVAEGRPAASSAAEIAGAVPNVDVVIEA